VCVGLLTSDSDGWWYINVQVMLGGGTLMYHHPSLSEVNKPTHTVMSFQYTPDDGCCDTRNMYSDFAVNKYLHTVASGWIFINIEL